MVISVMSAPVSYSLSTRHIERMEVGGKLGWNGWGYLARFMLIIGLVKSANTVVSSGYPQIKEMTNIAVGGAIATVSFLSLKNT